MAEGEWDLDWWMSLPANMVLVRVGKLCVCVTLGDNADEALQRLQLPYWSEYGPRFRYALLRGIKSAVEAQE